MEGVTVNRAYVLFRVVRATATELAKNLIIPPVKFG